MRRTLTKYEREPKKARAKGEAWWYANKRTIEVYIAGRGEVLIARIRRSDLVRYIKETGVGDA